MLPIRIDWATEKDVSTIREMIVGLAEYERLAHKVTATEDRLRETLFGERPAAEVLLAFWDGEPAGLALFFPNYSTFLAQPGIYLEDLFVKPAFRGKGIGFALLERLAKIAGERGCGRVEWQVLDWNAPSIEFYKRLGALPMEDWTTFRLMGEALAKLGGSGSA